MSSRLLIAELAKMRHLHVTGVVLVLGLAAAGIGLYAGIVNPDFDRTGVSAWNALLQGLGFGFTLAAPLLLAVVASRSIDAEHQGGGWVLAATSGVTPGGLFRAKLVGLGLLVAGATILASAFVAAAGVAAGIDVPWPAGRWIGLTLCVLTVNLVLLALYIGIATRIDNQLVCLGIGLLGTVLALFGPAVPEWIAHATPWGYYALSAAAGYVDAELVPLTPGYASVVALGVIAAVAITLTTRSLDRQEV